MAKSSQVFIFGIAEFPLRPSVLLLEGHLICRGCCAAPPETPPHPSSYRALRPASLGPHPCYPALPCHSPPSRPSRQMGLTTLFNFYAYPASCRLRISQVLVLSPWQVGSGTGAVQAEGKGGGGSRERQSTGGWGELYRTISTSLRCVWQVELCGYVAAVATMLRSPPPSAPAPLFLPFPLARRYASACPGHVLVTSTPHSPASAYCSELPTSPRAPNTSTASFRSPPRPVRPPRDPHRHVCTTPIDAHHSSSPYVCRASAWVRAS